jgi:hypothetical protein
MSTLAEAVHRGTDGSVHYLSSTPTGSQLIVTDPVLGVRRLSLDGPCRLTDPGGNTGSVVYESISAKESTTVTVSPGQEPSFHILGGFCTHCVFDAGGAGHDFDLWPECPFGDQVKEQIQDAAVVRLTPRPEPAPEPAADSAPEPAPRSGIGTSDAQAEAPEPVQSAPRVHALDVDPPLSKREREMRWGGPAGGW